MRNICCNQCVCYSALLCHKIDFFLVLLIYDYFLTLPLEISQIWSSRFTAAKLFYLLNRYGSIAFFVLNSLLWIVQTKSSFVCCFLFLTLGSSS